MSSSIKVRVGEDFEMKLVLMLREYYDWATITNQRPPVQKAIRLLIRELMPKEEFNRVYEGGQYDFEF